MRFDLLILLILLFALGLPVTYRLKMLILFIVSPQTTELASVDPCLSKTEQVT